MNNLELITDIMVNMDEIKDEAYKDKNIDYVVVDSYIYNKLKTISNELYKVRDYMNMIDEENKGD